jgi:hypothetical protein
MSDVVRRPRLVLGAIVLLAVALRFPTLDAQSFWRDEASTALSLERSFGGMIERLADAEGMPPLYFVLAWLWAKLFGLGEAGVRSFSAVAGTATVPVAWALGRRLGGDRAAVVAALLVAVSPFLVWFSQEARSYALLVLLCAVATLLFVRSLEEPRRRVVLGWGVAAAAALATHYFAAFLVAPQAAVLLVRAGRPAGPGVALLGLAALALAPLAIGQRDGRVDWVSDAPLSARATDVAKHWVAGPFGSPADAAVAIGLLLALAGLAAALGRRSVPLLATAGVAGVAVAGPVVLAVLGQDYVLDRYLIGALVPLLAVAAAGFAAGRLPLAAAGALAALSAAFTVAIAADDELHREDWRAVAARLDGRVPTLIVTTPDGEPPLRWYLGGTVSPAGETAQRVAVVASWRFGRPRPPAPPAPGLELERRVELPTATLLEYRRPPGAPVDAAALNLDPGEPPMLLFSPGA